MEKGIGMYNMDLHEVWRFEVGIGSQLITRVPGGWLYYTAESSTETFVPYNKEFKLLQDANSTDCEGCDIYKDRIDILIDKIKSNGMLCEMINYFKYENTVQTSWYLEYLESLKSEVPQ